MNLKASITVGVDGDGKYHCLYVGADAAAAREAIERLPEGITRAEVYRRPEPWKRRKVRAEDAEGAEQEDNNAIVMAKESDSDQSLLPSAATKVEIADVEKPRRRKK